MGKVTGFLETPRREARHRPVAVRLRDWREVYEPQRDDELAEQAGRCMDCGIPFCSQGCPLGNRIPTFNDHVYREQWSEAATQLFATNNFPEFTGRLCPAPCESACVLALGPEPVTIERLEYEIAEHAFARGLAVSQRPAPDTGRRVAVVGSGPAGLAAAAQLRLAGHAVTIYERADAIGGLLRYGIPEFKMEKRVLDRRLSVMADDGVRFVTETEVGVDLSLERLGDEVDAIVLALGATRPRPINVPGEELNGVYPAMTYLEAANRAVRDARESTISARGQRVVILGGGDTGADCLGTVHRQGASAVAQIEILERPPDERPSDQPWPTMARLLKTTPAHEEGGERRFATETLALHGAGRLREIELRDRDSGSVVREPVDLVLIAAGFLGPELAGLGLAGAPHTTTRDTLAVDETWRVTSLDLTTPVFACGDAVRGQSLIVWAIAEGRSAAAAVDGVLSGAASSLRAPLGPYTTSW